VKNPGFKNVIFDVPDKHNSTISGFLRCEKAVSENIEITNSSGVAVEHTLCYDFEVKNIEINKPHSVTSGKGYGVAAAKSRKGRLSNINGFKTRHTVDFDSCYDIKIDGIDEGYGLGVPVMLSHNGYGGKISAKNIKVTIDTLANYGVQMSDQGLLDADKQCFRDIEIENVEVTVPNHKTGNLNEAIRIANHFSSVKIGNIKLTSISDAGNLITRTTVVKLKGNQQGALEITNVESPKVETIILVERKNAAHKKMHNTIIKGIESDFVRNA